ncbi:GNAT family N-acetyltransferase [Bacillus sp. CECT 9360]|uniref:GNAT family N-acetyltransferase n=1 Tax=Bacillus sp. CECT 9360 TaxID=2845821 RepID=UPI001E4F1AF3|nr:GNAT family N-acetyltransferase [Bacillus sp. CECT 9360]CAH0346743.1 hypothetical protein BCI9360_03089 [Bacillus sp. CECT 9360]
MIIRRATPDDAVEAAYLIREAIKDIAEALTGEKDEGRIMEVLRQYFQQDVNRLSYRNCIVSMEEDEMSGIIVVYHGSEADELDLPINERLREISGDPAIKAEKEAEPEDYYIDTISVKAAFQGKGIGTKLIEAAEQQAEKKGHARISLIVEKDNPNARHLYERLGYHSERMMTINHHSYDYMVKIL